jgi:hypothetical protein
MSRTSIFGKALAKMNISFNVTAGPTLKIPTSLVFSLLLNHFIVVIGQQESRPWSTYLPKCWIFLEAWNVPQKIPPNSAIWPADLEP